MSLTRQTNNFDTTTFEELNFQPHRMGIGKQCIVQFPNGYGATIVQGLYTYGGENGLYELAVLGTDGQLTYETPITDDVLGNLSEQEIEETLIKIKNL